MGWVGVSDTIQLKAAPDPKDAVLQLLRDATEEVSASGATGAYVILVHGPLDSMSHTHTLWRGSEGLGLPGKVYLLQYAAFMEMEGGKG